MRALTEEGVRFLLSDLGQRRLVEIAGAKTDPLGLLQRLRREGLSPDQASWLVDQAQLRVRARGKLPTPERLLLTGEALEQASGLEVTGWRSRRLQDRQRVLDLGAGIGGDSLALAAAGLQVVAVERDPIRVLLLRHNVAALDLAERVEVREEDWTASDWTGERTAFIDPARRVRGKRVTSLHAMVPPLADLSKLAGVVPGVMAKVAPAVDKYEVPPAAGLEFVSVRGELKEALLTWGDLSSGASPRAVLLPGPHVLEREGPEPAPRTAAPGGFLYEPDPAVLRAGLVRTLGQRLDAWQLDAQLAYLSGDEPRETPFARCFRVLRQGPFQRKALVRWLRELEAGTLTLKRRGVPIGDDLAKRLPSKKGGRPVTVFLTRGPSGPLALVTEPVGPVG